MTSAPRPAQPGRIVLPVPPGGCGDSPADDIVAAQRLWDALILARADQVAAHAAQDAVFRFYLPMAHAMAHHPAHAERDRTLTGQAAELGLAKAVLAWRDPDSQAFTVFAHAAIQSQIRQIPTAGGRRSSRAPAAAGPNTDPFTRPV
ncbi:MAG TPA: hypothetical protein VIJ00_08665 [Nakamurella sp.]